MDKELVTVLIVGLLLVIGITQAFQLNGLIQKIGALGAITVSGSAQGASGQLSGGAAQQAAASSGSYGNAPAQSGSSSQMVGGC